MTNFGSGWARALELSGFGGLISSAFTLTSSPIRQSEPMKVLYLGIVQFKLVKYADQLLQHPLRGQSESKDSRCLRELGGFFTGQQDIKCCRFTAIQQNNGRGRPVLVPWMWKAFSKMEFVMHTDEACSWQDGSIRFPHG